MAVEELTIRARLRDELSRPLRNVRDAVDDVADETDRLGDKARRADRELSTMGTGVGGLASKLKGPLVAGAKLAAAALVGVGVGAVAGLGKAISLATDAGETASKFGTVFAGQREEMDAWAAEMHAAYGITTKDLQDAASGFGVFAKAAGIADGEIAGFSKDLVGASTDLASFYNAPVDEVFAAMQSGLAGQSEPLRRFGIFLSDASLNAHALEQGIGKTTKEMTEGEKVALRQSFIMSQLGDAEGDLARTSGSLANVTKALKGRLTEAGTAIGTAFLPYAEEAAGKVNVWAQEVMPRLQEKLDAVPGKIREAGWAFGEMSDAWAAGASLGDTVAAGLGSLGVEAEGVAPLIDSVVGVLRDVWTVLSDLLWPAFQEASAILPGFTSPLGVARDVLGYFADNAETLVPVVSALVTGFLAWKAATLAYNAVTAIANAVTFLRTAATSGLAAAQLGATGATGALAAGTATLNAIMALNPIVLVVAAIAALVAGLVIAYKRSDRFRALVDKLWDTVKRAGRAIRDAFGKALEWVSDKLSMVSEKIGKMRDKLSSIPGVGRLFGGGAGDTATPKGGAGNLASTLATHAAISGTGPRITNALVGGFAGSDHHAGRALDLKGSNLISYAQAVRNLGGYAAFHGAGANRHLHAAYGDTPRPRARAAARPSSSGGAATLTLNGPLIGQVNASSEVDVERAARRALDAWVRDQRERS